MVLTVFYRLLRSFHPLETGLNVQKRRFWPFPVLKGGFYLGGGFLSNNHFLPFLAETRL